VDITTQKMEPNDLHGAVEKILEPQLSG